MNILHVQWGYSPWREGGLILYAADLMEYQTGSGHTVAAFFPGRRGFWGKPFLAVWKRGRLTNYEIRNSPLVHLGNRGTFPPEEESGEPISEGFFIKVIEEFKPDVIHIHELAGLPFTLIDICKQRRLPLVMTLHDYFPLCPTLNLYDQRGGFCSDACGVGCVECCRMGSDWGLRDRFRTVVAEGKSKCLYAVPLLMRYTFDLLMSGKGPVKEELENVYRERRLRNIARLKDVDIIIAQSTRTRDIYAMQTGRTDIIVAHSSLSHIEHLTPRRMRKVEPPVHFVTLNGAMAPYKGAQLISDCVGILKQRGYDGAYRLDIYGDVYRPVRRSLLSFSSVHLKGKYARNDLNRLLDEADVGIVPSLWEEVYGYVGIEFLAKGVPVIGNHRGGILDYTIEGCTGWINTTCSAKELADIMERIISNPDCILPLNDWISKNRRQVIVDKNEHFDMILDCYEEAISGRGGHK